MEPLTNERPNSSSGQARRPIVVIQCAASKRSCAEHLETRDGRRVKFVAAPDLAPQCDGWVYAHPDDASDAGLPWRQVLRDYNERPEANALGLLPAWRLYRPRTYKLLKDCFGLDRLFILSAGWGVLPADFLTPNYDITFSPVKAGEKFKRRTRDTPFRDFPFRSPDSDSPIVFFGGQKYVPLFRSLTEKAKNPRIIYYAGREPNASDCTLRSFRKPYTNWHYTCAEEFAKANCD